MLARQKLSIDFVHQQRVGIEHHVNREGGGVLVRRDGREGDGTGLETARQRQDFSERCPTPRSRADEVAAKRCKLASVNQVADAFERLGDLDVREVLRRLR